MISIHNYVGTLMLQTLRNLVRHFKKGTSVLSGTQLRVQKRIHQISSHAASHRGRVKYTRKKGDRNDDVVQIENLNIRSGL